MRVHELLPCGALIFHLVFLTFFHCVVFIVTQKITLTYFYCYLKDGL